MQDAATRPRYLRHVQAHAIGQTGPRQGGSLAACHTDFGPEGWRLNRIGVTGAQRMVRGRVARRLPSRAQLVHGSLQGIGDRRDHGGQARSWSRRCASTAPVLAGSVPLRRLLAAVLTVVSVSDPRAPLGQIGDPAL